MRTQTNAVPQLKFRGSRRIPSAGPVKQTTSSKAGGAVPCRRAGVESGLNAMRLRKSQKPCQKPEKSGERHSLATVFRCFKRARFKSVEKRFSPLQTVRSSAAFFNQDFR
jgi:hypothetical protein